jgi:hypothetical protein
MFGHLCLKAFLVGTCKWLRDQSLGVCLLALSAHLFEAPFDENKT